MVNRRHMVRRVKPFWFYVKKTRTCWEWVGCIVWLTDGSPHTVYWTGERQIQAHRHAWKLFHGEEPPHKLLHGCGNAVCVNPAHLVPTSPENTFWMRVRKTRTCWEWTGSTKSSGYGVHTIAAKSGRSVVSPAHRFSWELHSGRPVPKGKLVLHKCDNRTCVNPSHLYIGTSTDNRRDTLRRSPRHKRMILRVRDVQKLREEGARLARKYGVTQSTLGRIVSGEAWKWLLRPTAQEGKQT